jgi:DNA polymerase IV
MRDPELKILRLFYNIWGVGPDTARRFYFTNGWKELDDIVEFGWHSITRVQQIGVKYWDEFQIPIPREEVEGIAAMIKTHARLAAGITEDNWDTDDDVVCVVVGGYRRGKKASGDVDVILSHRREEVTKDLVVDVVRSLEEAEFITHTLTLQTTTSDRDQATLPYRSEGHHGHGFDSLDKALCVWQDPVWEGKVGDGGEEVRKKNPNVHRRVDIILSPWRTVGCAILGWSGGTTFQRDIRRYVSHEKGWKFDSSGVRDRGSGMPVDLERPRERYREDGTEREEWEWKDDWLSREKRVMEGIGIGWRPASERCTG